MRKLFSILLLLFVGLPIASPLFALGASVESSLPACCRRGGTHHCMAGMLQTDQHGTTLTQRMERCPYCPSSLIATHPGVFLPATSAVIFSGLLSHPTGTAQTESKRRIARDRSSQKRGPPASSLL